MALAPAVVDASPVMPDRTRFLQLGREIAYHLLALPAAIVCFTWVVTGVSLSAGLAVLVVGLPVALVVIRVDRWLAQLERLRAALVLGRPIPALYRSAPAGATLATRIKTVFADPQTYKDIGWLLLVFPLGVAGFSLVVTVWSAVLGLITLPAWFWALGPNDIDLGIFEGDTLPKALVACAAGLALVPVAWWLTHIKALADAHLARIVLAPSEQAVRLSARVEHLTESRAGAVDQAHDELARIERDLHDGAQARLVALAMDLGMAEQKLAAAEHDEARALMVEARGQAREALGELRDLVRGIGPSILRDRGLDAALTALVAGRTPPVDLHVEVPDRPAAAVETAAYFAAAEGLANAAKHAPGARVSVRAWEALGRLVVEVSDDGPGGADTAKGSGLRGLAQRVGALDGTLTVTSPPGGPTTIRAELPCAS